MDVQSIISIFQNILVENLYINFLIIVVAFLIASFIISFVIKRILKKMALKTKTDADDKLIDRIHKPIISFIVLVGINVALIVLQISENIITTLSNVFNSLYIIIGAYLAYLIIGFAITSIGIKITKKTASTLDDELIPLFHKVANVIIILFTFIILLKQWGIDVTALLAGIGIAGIAIGFAVKDSLSNIFGGISIIFDRTFIIGDIIKLADGTSGTVVDVGLRSTRIRTWDNELVIIPNGQLSNSNVLNKTLPDLSIRTVIAFGVEYGSDVEMVKETVLKELMKLEDVIKEGDRKPSIRLSDLGASALKFNAYLWVDNYSKKFVMEEKALIAIYNSLNKAGIIIPYQTFTVYNKKE